MRQSRMEVTMSLAHELVEEFPISAVLIFDSDGVYRVGKTRVTVDTIIEAFHEGLSAEAMVEQYPSLRLDEVYIAIGYYLRHRTQFDGYLRQREQVAEKVR